MTYYIASVRVPMGEQPVCGVLIEPYIMFRDDVTNSITINSFSDEMPNSSNGSSGSNGGYDNSNAYVSDKGGYSENSRYVLRSRWYRQPVSANACVCTVHPDKDATIQCVLCLRNKVPPQLSYHCNGECLRAHWHMHRTYHTKYFSQAQTQMSQNGGMIYENGTNGANGYNIGFCRNNNIFGYNQPEDDWIEISQCRCYVPIPEDVGCVLKYECVLVDTHESNRHSRSYPSFQNGSGDNFTSYETDLSFHDHSGHHSYQESKVFSKQLGRVKPAPSPPIRSMIPLRLTPNARTTQDGCFTVLTYNILADLYATSGDFYLSYCPAWALSWHYRRQNLVKELVNYQADVMCLQEVQSNHYEDYLKDALEECGYASIFKRKTAEFFIGKTAAMEGCATFYRKDRFVLIKKYEVEFSKAAVSTANHYPEPTKNIALQRLSKDNVALIVVLESKEAIFMGNKQLICVANTHIHSNPENSDIKLWQVHTLLKGLEKIAASAEIPIIVAGDFNSEPGSAAHTLMVTQGIDSRHPETTYDPAHFLKSMLPVKHKLPLRSAYSSFYGPPTKDPLLQEQCHRMDANTREPIFTNYTKQYKGTLDYVFYTPALLQPIALLELPSEEEAEIEEGCGLPNARYSSDHICLMAEFQCVIPNSATANSSSNNSTAVANTISSSSVSAPPGHHHHAYSHYHNASGSKPTSAPQS